MKTMKLEIGKQNQPLALGARWRCWSALRGATGNPQLPIISLRSLAVVALLCLPSADAPAASKNWNGSSNGYWATGANWDGGVAPAEGDDLVFPSTAFRFTITNNISNLSIRSIAFIAGSGYVIRGNPITLTDGIGSLVASGGTNTIELAITNAASQGYENLNTNTSLTIRSNIILRKVRLTISGSGQTFLSGEISGMGEIVKTGSGTCHLTGSMANTFSGGTSVNEGTLVLGKTVANGAIPEDLVIGDGLGGTNADVVRTVGVSQIADGGNVVVNSSGLLDISAGPTNEIIGSLAGAGNVELGNRTLCVNYNDSSTVFSGVISGPGGSLNKLGSGTLMLTGNNTYSGTTTVSTGTLLVNGLQPQSTVMLESSGLLGGSGTVGFVYGSGTVAPGTSPGILTVVGDFLVWPPGNFVVELNGPSPGTGYDQLNVNGSVTLFGPALQATLGFVSPSNTSFTIINNDLADVVVDRFAGLPEGATFNINGTPFRITYAGGDGNDVVLTQLADTQRPLLQIAQAGGTNVVLSWPTNFTGFTLEAKTNVTATVWSVVSPAPVVVGTNYHVTNPVTGLQRYYRLRIP